MADSTFGFKPSKKEKLSSQGKAVPIAVQNFTGSLALRVFFISFGCLVFPLIIYCFMMYRYDFDVKQSQQAQVLNLVSDIQVSMLDRLMNFKFQTLEQITLYIGDKLEKSEAENAVISQKLQKLVQVGNLESIFVLKKNISNNAVCTISSGKYEIGKAYNNLFLVSALKENDYALLVDDEAKVIYFIKVLQRGKNREVLTTLNLVISTQFLMKYLTEAEGYRGAYKIFFFNQNAVVFDGQDPELIGKKVIIDPQDSEKRVNEIVLNTIPMETDTYEYYHGDHHLYATIVSLAQLDLNVLITRVQVKEAYYLREFFYQTILLFISILILGGIGAIFLTYRMSKPLKRLCQVMAKVSNNDLSTRYESCAYGFEINKVGEMFNTMIQNLIYHLQQLQEKTVQQQILQQELHIGHQIQKSLVPTQIPEVPGIEIQTVLIPAKEVGGDFYDFFVNPSNPDEVILLIADTSGHGVFGCFYSLTMRSILRSLGSTIPDLREVIIKANQLFCKDSEATNVFVTAWVGSYNHKTHELRYSSCGHPLGFVFRNTKFFKELTTPGIALGVIEEIEPVMDSFQLEPGDTVIFITDGLIEAHNPEGKLYGKQRFIESVEKHYHLSIEKLCELVVYEVESFEVNAENQHDDLTMVILRIR